MSLFSASAQLAVTSHREKEMGEMKSKKRLLLAGVIAAVAVLAVPALASAAVWKHGGTNLSKFVSLGLSGGELFETTAGNGMSCELHATLTTEGGSTGKITAFETKKCPTGFGTFAKCELSSAEALGLPWTVHVNATDLSITGWHTKRKFKAGCATSELDKTLGTVTMTLITPAAISEMEWLKEITGYKSGGSFTVDGTNKGTYGIG